MDEKARLRQIEQKLDWTNLMLCQLGRLIIVMAGLIVPSGNEMASNMVANSIAVIRKLIGEKK